MQVEVYWNSHKKLFSKKSTSPPMMGSAPSKQTLQVKCKVCNKPLELDIRLAPVKFGRLDAYHKDCAIKSMKDH